MEIIEFQKFVGNGDVGRDMCWLDRLRKRGQGRNLTARDLRLVRAKQTGAINGGAVAKIQFEIGHLLVGARCGFAGKVVAAVIRDLLRCQQARFMSGT